MMAEGGNARSGRPQAVKTAIIAFQLQRAYDYSTRKNTFMQNNGESSENVPDNVQIYLQDQLNRYTEERDEAEKKMRDASIHIIKLRKALNAYNEPHHKLTTVDFPIAERI